MKKVFVGLLSLVALGAVAYASVNAIRSNGSISGAASYQVQCSSGSTYVIYKKGGTWYSGGSGHMGHKYDSWSTNDVANYLCN